MANNSYTIKSGVLTLKPQASPPSNAHKGDLYIDSADSLGLPQHYNGSAFVKLVNETGSQTLTNKTLSSANNTIIIDGDQATLTDIALTSLKTNLSDASKFIVRDASGIPVSNSKAVPSGIVVGDTDSQTLTNKTLTAPVVNSPTGIVKADVGLSNVDNTSDANKPISDDTQDALDLKAPIASPTFTGTVSGITKSMVGLSNVDNTSDATKNSASVTLTGKTISGSDNTISNINASNLSTGTVPTARMGSGSASSSTYLRGDNTWQTTTIGAGSVGTTELANGGVTIPKITAIVASFYRNSSWNSTTTQTTINFDTQVYDTNSAVTTNSTITGNRTSGSAIITGIASTSGVKVGQAITGTGIPAQTIIQSIDSSTQITMSQNATSGTSTSTTITAYFVFITPVTGYYHIEVQANSTSGTANNALLKIRKNGVSKSLGRGQNNGGPTSALASTVIHLTIGDAIDAQIHNLSTNIVMDTGEEDTYIHIYAIGV